MHKYSVYIQAFSCEGETEKGKKIRAFDMERKLSQCDEKKFDMQLEFHITGPI